MMTQSDIIEEYGISRTTIWRLRRSGDFPKPIRFPTGGSLFSREDIENFFISLKANVGY
ncbi:MAG: helix-turn-helix transcriptional regulator [Endozoicomonas sp.]